MFEVTGQDISELNDTDLRTLFVSLCEAELIKAGAPISGITAGGSQDAPDGGIDVRVETNEQIVGSGFIPRRTTVFQVKVPDMAQAEVRKEMCPNGTLRSSIADLVSCKGAYIIASSKSSVSDTGLTARRDAMASATSSLKNSDQLALDFYDRERIASWVRLYPGVVHLVRKMLGRPLEGWQPYSSWSNPSEPSDSVYLADTNARLFDDRVPREGGLSIESGIQRVREVLASPKGTARLIGLSGLGKRDFLRHFLTKESAPTRWTRRLLYIRMSQIAQTQRRAT